LDIEPKATHFALQKAIATESQRTILTFGVVTPSWLLGLYIESDLQIINGVRRRKKPWHRVSMVLHGESKERWSVSMDQPLK
jgi:hypothetical protein